MNTRRTIIATLTLALVALAAACGATDSGPNSPSGVSKRFIEAARSKDVNTFKSLLSKASLASIEKDAKEAGMTADAMITRVLEQDLFKTSGDIEIRNEKISGDKATVEIKDDKGKWSENELVKEDGNWKVSIV